MEERTRGNYVIAGRETVAEGADLRVVVLTLDQGQYVPWHYHSTITDSFVCLEGPMVVETRGAACGASPATRPALRHPAEDGALRARRG